jgi:hypothetical protein
MRDSGRAGRVRLVAVASGGGHLALHRRILSPLLLLLRIEMLLLLLLLLLLLRLLIERLERVEIVGEVLHVGREGRRISWWSSKGIATAALALLAQMAMVVGVKTMLALCQARV